MALFGVVQGERFNVEGQTEDMRRSTKRLPDLLPGDPVWIPDQKVAGTVLNKAGTPRYYSNETPKGQLRRNRCHLNSLTESLTESDSEASGVLPTCDGTSNSTVQTQKGDVT